MVAIAQYNAVVGALYFTKLINLVGLFLFFYCVIYFIVSLGDNFIYYIGC